MQIRSQFMETETDLKAGEHLGIQVKGEKNT